MNQQQPWYYSWPVIIIAFILFWPLGIVLLIMKGKSSKQSIFVGSSDKKFYIVIGVILILLGLTNIKDSALVGLFMIIGGIALILYAEQMAKRANRNKKYIDMIVNQRITSLDTIASTNNISYDNVQKEIRQLITLGVLKDAQIDEMHHSITLAQPSVSQSPVQGIQQKNPDDSAAAGTVVVTCPGCGAKVSVRAGQTISCEYCDTPITGK